MSKSWEALKKRLDAALGKKAPRGAVAEFCRATGFARSSVQNWMDRDQSPTIENLDRIAKGLGMEERPWQLLRPEEPASGLAAAPRASDLAFADLIERIHQIPEGDAAELAEILWKFLKFKFPELTRKPLQGLHENTGHKKD